MKYRRFPIKKDLYGRISKRAKLSVLFMVTANRILNKTGVLYLSLPDGDKIGCPSLTVLHGSDVVKEAEGFLLCNTLPPLGEQVG